MWLHYTCFPTPPPLVLDYDDVNWADLQMSWTEPEIGAWWTSGVYPTAGIYDSDGDGDGDSDGASVADSP